MSIERWDLDEAGRRVPSGRERIDPVEGKRMANSEPMNNRAGASPTGAVAGSDGDALHGGTGGEEDEAGTVGSSSLLDDAARLVAAEWRRNPDRRSIAGVTSQLARIVELVAVVADGGSDVDVRGQATALRLRLLDRIRRELLLGIDRDAVDEAELLALLRSLEATSEALESDWARRFGLVLSRPHGVDVAAEIAHGLRSSCTSLLFVAEILRDGIYGDLNEKQRRQVDALYSGALALGGALSDITELSWRTEEPGQGGGEALSLQEVADSVRSLLKPLAIARGVTIDFDLRIRTGRRGHPRALRHALLNLVLHAVLEGGGDRVSVEIRAAAEESVNFLVRVSNSNGRERPPVTGDRYRILREAVADDYSFSIEGLRLHVARHLVTALGGELEHRKEEDGSLLTTFTLILPPDSVADDD